MSRLSKLLKKTLILGSTVCVLLAVGVVIAWIAFPRNVQIGAPFVAEPLEINSLDFYDLGAVDVNRDGNLDLFTTNHSSLQSLLISDGHGGYIDRLTTMGLNQVRDIPALEDVGHAPEFNLPGLYIYFVQSELFLRQVSASGSGTSGTLTIPGEPRIGRNNGFDIELDHSTVGEKISTVGFATDTDGTLAISVTKSAPIRVSLNRELVLENIFLGTRLINPPDHEFELFLKDRHGIAWADINDDDVMDAYMSRGALFGSLAELPGEMGDQFFVSRDGGQYADRFTELGFEKRDCPARQVAWTDANSDGLLDLYIACGRQVGGFWEYVPTAFRRSRDEAPNMLYLQDTTGNFHESAKQLGLDFAVGGTFLWLDIDLDNDSDLIWASEIDISLYRNTPDGFVAEVIVPGATTIQARKLTAADFDKDGDTDVFVAASLGSVVLRNNAGYLRAEDPELLGLPSSTRTAAWVDYDNDGRTDFYSWPGGIYRQSRPGHFDETGMLRVPSPFWALVDPRVLWFDADNDGDRDLIVMQRFFPQAIQKLFPNAMPFTSELLRNDLIATNQWIQIDLFGPPDNREAVGATILFVTDKSSELQQAGQFENSHYSQGHYRNYFAANQDETVEQIIIGWPNGDRSEVHDPAAGYLIQIKWMPEIDAVE